MADAHLLQSRGASSRDSRLVPQRRRSAFSSFLSMSSDDGDDGVEDEDEDDANALLRIQQQADGSICRNSSLELERIRTEIGQGAGENGSCGLVVAQQGAPDDIQSGDQWRGLNILEGVTAEKAVPDLSYRGSDGVTKDEAVDRDSGHCGNWSSELLSAGSHEDSFFDEPRPSFSDEHSFTEADSFTAVDTSFVYRSSLMDDYDDSGAQYNTHGELDSRSFVGRRTISDEGGNSTGELEHVRPKSLTKSGLEHSLNPVENSKESHGASKVKNGISIAEGVHLLSLQDDDSTLAVVVGQTSMASPDILIAQKNGYVYCPASLGADNEIRGKAYQMGSLAKSGDTRAARENDKLVAGADGDGNTEDENRDVPSILSMSMSSHSWSSGAVSFECKITDSAYRFHDDKAAPFPVRSDSPSITNSCASSTPFKVDKTEAFKIPQLHAKVSVARLRAQYEEDVASRTPTDVSISDTSRSTTAPTCTAAPDSIDKSAQGGGKKVDFAHASVSDAFRSTGIVSGLFISRQSSADLSKVSSRQMTATSKSWRNSLLDSKNSKDAYDKDVGPLRDGFLLSQESALRIDHNNHCVESRIQARCSVACAKSAIVASHYSSANLCVDRCASSLSSMSLDSRPPGEDSLAKGTIPVDEVGQIEKHSSDRVLSQATGWPQIQGSSGVNPAASATSDSSYNDSVNVADGQVYATSLNGSIVSFVASQSLASSDELSFVSFHAAQPTTPPGPSRLLKQGAAEEKRLSTPAIVIPGPNKAAHKLERVVYRSIVVPHNNDDKSIKTPRSPAISSAYSISPVQFSSAALLAAIKTRDVRTDSRYDATVDVVLSSSRTISSSLTISRISRDQKKSVSLPVPSRGDAGIPPPLILPQPVTMSFTNRSSVASSAESADRLDFTGVYRGSPSSLGTLDNNGNSRKLIQSEVGTRYHEMEQRSLGDRRATSKPKNLERSKSDGRAMQCKARCKMEDFFQQIDEREVFRSVNRPKRACATVVQSAGIVEENPRSNVSHSTKMVKVIDLKNLCSGGNRPGWHLSNDALILTPQQRELTEQGAMAMTSPRTGSGIFTTRSIASAEYITKPMDYVLSPQGAAANETNMLDTGKDQALNIRDSAKSSGSASSTFFPVLLDPRESDGGRLGAISGWRAFNMSQTPTMARGAGNESPAFPVPPSAALSTTPIEIDGARDTVDDGRSLPGTFARTISTFMRKRGSDSNGLKQSVAASPFRASGMSFSQRTTFADRVQSLSASVSRAVRRLLPGRDARGPNGIANCTSPESQCTSPAALRRAYDHSGFYGTPFKVPGLNKPLPQSKELQYVGNDRDWVRQWLLLATCAVLGLSLGAILVRVVAFDSSLFNLSSAEVHERRESTGQLVLAPGTRWLLLPGHLFLRAWSAVTTPLLVCYVVNALSDLVGCADKCALVRSSRSMAYALLLALIATVEGVLAMYLTHMFGWFRGSRRTAQAAALTLSDAIGTTPLPGGAVGLLCSSNDAYLQRLGHNAFTCSNASLMLPLSEGISTSFSDIADSGPAVFALQDVSSVFKYPTSGAVYYPALLETMFNSHGSSAASVLSTRTPHTLVAQSILEKSDGMISLEGLVQIALPLGYVCGKRILRLRRDAQAAMFESRHSAGPAHGDPQKSCYYIVGFSMELQLALEWLIRPIERYLAPVGFFSLMLGQVVLHHREWRSFAAPMLSLLVVGMAAFLVHIALVLPIVRTQFCDSRRRLPLLATAQAFVPAFLFVFTADNVALSAPVTMQCFARVLTVTRSAAQLLTAVTAAFFRNARALYLPLVLLWLLETSSPLEDELKLSAFDYVSIGLLSMLSCFCGGSSRLTLTMARTLWFMKVRAQSPEAARLMPATMPLLIVCDVILSRVASIVTLADHLVLAQLTAQHWGETVVQGRTVEPSDDYMSSFSPLDDSQAPCRPSSAMLSSVYL